LGYATAKILAAHGAHVTCADINAAQVSDAAASITAENHTAIGVPCDVTDPASIAAMINQATATHGTPRIVINCAGIVAGARLVGRKGAHDPALFAKVVQVNLIGTFQVMSQAAAAMQAAPPIGADNERGVIINTASIAAFEGQIGQAAYAASKGGVAALTLPAAREFAKSGIRVCAIAPGLFHTPMLEGMPDDVYDSLVATTLFPNRLGAPEEFGRLALSVVDNPMLNGTVLRLDGALRLAPM
jgi:NAD(P)-dependent dehydrogenase (short-subunit alcohol dehydrogenase family)